MTIDLRAVVFLPFAIAIAFPAISNSQVLTPRDTRPAAPVTPTGTASIAGAITIAGSGLPARGARVTLSGQDSGGSRSATTDELGRFSFAALPAGRYNLNASKNGFIGVSYGQPRPGRSGGTPIQLAEGSQFAARLQIFKGGVLTGTVLDENAEAIPRTSVRVLRYMMQSGQRTLQPSGSGSTDDRGVYRVFGLPPGDYIICATPPNNGVTVGGERMQVEMDALRQQVSALARTDEAAARDMMTRAAVMQAQITQAGPHEQATGYAPVYYPGTVSPGEAGTVSLAAAEEKQALDLQLQRVPIARIDGVVVDPAGHSLTNIMVTLVNSGKALPGIDAKSTRARAEGRFIFDNVAPGQYMIVAQSTQNDPPSPPAAPAQARSPTVTAPGPESTGSWAMTPVAVDGRNLANVVLSLQPGMTLSGSVQFQTTTRQVPADLTRVRLTLSSVDRPTSGVARVTMQTAAGRVDANGRFTITGIAPGKYRLTASNPGAGWFLESTLIEGQNSLDLPVEIRPGQNLQGATVTFTDRQAELSGTITDERGQPAPQFTILVYPSDPRLWGSHSQRIRTTRAATDGRFTMTGLPPGDYHVTPIGDMEPGSWHDPAVLQQLDSGAERVKMNEGEKKVQNLKVSSGGL